MWNRARPRHVRWIGSIIAAGARLAPAAVAGAAENDTDGAWHSVWHPWGRFGGSASVVEKVPVVEKAIPPRDRAARFLARLDDAVPEATSATPLLTTGGEARPDSMGEFLSEVLTSV